MNLLTDLELEPAPNTFQVVVEVPRGSQVKLKYRPEPPPGIFEWSRAMRFGMAFPYDFGFFPQTVAGDRDAIDAMVLSEVPSYPGVVVRARIIGALRVTQNRGQGERRNDRVFVVPVNEHRQQHLNDVSELSQRARDELEEFFRSSLVLTGKTVKFGGWSSSDEATAHVREGAAHFASR